MTTAMRPDAPAIAPTWLARRSWGVAYLVAVIAAMIAGRDLWWPGRYVVSYDGATYSGPYVGVTMDAIGDGRLPLLNEWIFGGVPHLGNHSTGVLYLPRYLALVVDTHTAHAWLVVGHLVLLAVGMVALSRRLSLSPLAASVAAAAAVLAGATTAKSVQFEQILVLAWLPVLLWSVHRLLEPGSHAASRILGTTAVVAGVVVAGHPQIIIEVAYVVAVFTGGLLIDAERRRNWWRLAVAGVWAMALVLPQVVATLAARSGADLTTGRTMDDLARTPYVLQIRQMVRSVFGTVINRDAAVFSGAFEAIVFLGVAGSILSVVGAVVASRDPLRRHWAFPLALFGVVAVIWSLGSRTPIFRVAHAVLPGFDLARVPARWLCVVVIIAALFIGVAVDTAPALSRRTVGALGVAGLGVAVAIAGPIAGGTVPVLVIWVITASAVLGAYLLSTGRRGALVAVLIVEVLWLSMNAIPGDITRTSAPPPPATNIIETIAADGGSAIALTPDFGDYDELVLGLRPNANAWFNIRSIDGYDGGVQVTERWTRIADRFTDEPIRELPLRSSLTAPIDPVTLARLGVRWVVLDDDRSATEWVPNWEGPVAVDGQRSLWENPAWFGEAWVWPRATSVDDLDGDLAAQLGDPTRTMALGAVVNGAGTTCDGVCAPQRANLDRVSPERLVVDVSTSTGGVLTLDRQYLDDWSVTIDGEDASSIVVDDVLLGVRIAPGEHIVVFTYRPGWVAPSMLVAAAAVLLFGVTAAWTMRRALLLRSGIGQQVGAPPAPGITS